MAVRAPLRTLPRFHSGRFNSTYDSGRACEQEKLALTGHDKMRPPPDRGAMLLRWAHDELVCLAADDPRLKRK